MPIASWLVASIVASLWICGLGATGAPVELAPPDRTDSKILERAATAWAFQPVDRSLAPPSVDRAGAEEPNAIDGFVRASLRAKGLQPAPLAAPRDLLRRLHFDLLGLPPTPEESDAFEADPSMSHYRRVVDDLLNRPQFGERWARHWLDLARYTESSGFEYDRIRDQAWPYRDYVIRAFNEDKPYDRFMMEQIAGDVLEPVTRDGIVATSLLVCGAYDQAGNGQANLTQRTITREEELEDLISVIGQTFLGLTLNCARCHEHKFDPVTLTDYYRVKSVFDGIYHGVRPIETPKESKEREARASALKASIARAESQITAIHGEGWKVARARYSDRPAPPGPRPWLSWDFENPTPEVAVGTLQGGAVVRDGRLVLPKAGGFFQSPPLSRDIREKTLEGWVALDDLTQGGGAVISIETPDGGDFDAIVFAERQPRKWMAGSGGFRRTRDLEAIEETASAGGSVHVAIVYDSEHRVTVYRNGEPYGKPYVPEGKLATYPAGKARVFLGLRHPGGGRPWLTGAIRRAALHDRALSPDEVAASFRASGFSIPEEEVIAALSPAQRASRDAALATIAQAKSELLRAEQPEMVAYAGVRKQPAPTQRFRRGDVRSPDGAVTPGALSALKSVSGDFDLAPDAPEAERRTRFARWLADPSNPLPSRAIANRVWHYHFGQGLVSTPSDLGGGGSKPSHPELLDWLAARLIDGGWSLKALHRLIVTSATYRQSAAYDARAAAIDADNQLLWRFTPRRLEAETLRDAMLAVSGRLDRRVGGPSFRPFTTTDFNATFYHPFDRDEPEFNRRTVYRMNVNSGKDPLLDVFDCPDPSVKTPRRASTTTPLQALGLMNGSFTLRQARLLAERAAADSPRDVPSQIRSAYRLALGRAPTPHEGETAAAATRERGLASVCWVLLNTTEFLYVR